MSTLSTQLFFSRVLGQLPVSAPDSVPDNWSTNEIRAKHPELSDRLIRRAVRLAQERGDAGYIGRYLISKKPKLL